MRRIGDMFRMVVLAGGLCAIDMDIKSGPPEM